MTRSAGRTRSPLGSRSGAVSTMLAVLTAACLVVLGVFVQGARIRAVEAGLLRAVRAAADGALAGYSGALWQRYGILAVDTGLRTSDGRDWRTRARAYFEDASPLDAGSPPFEANAGRPLSDPEVLVPAIRAFVLERMPALALALFLERALGWSATGSAVSFDPLFDAGGSGEAPSGDDWGALLLERLRSTEAADGEPVDPGAIGRPAVGSGDPYTVADAAQGLRDCVAAVAALNRETASDPEVPSLPSPLDPDGIAAFLAEDEGGGAAADAWLGRAAVHVYALTMFRSRVGAVAEEGGARPLRDLRGRALDGLSTALRLEVEEIAAGKGDDEANRAAVERRLLAMRFGLRLLSECVDEESRKRALLLGESLSALLAAASSGALPIPGGFLASAFQAVWAFADAQADVAALVAGEAVPALPGALGALAPDLVDMTATYGDHLAVLLLAVPERTQLARIAERIAANAALLGSSEPRGKGLSALSSFAAAIDCGTSFRGRRIAWSTGRDG